MEQITLYFRQGSSDKVYQGGIEAKDGGYVVNFAFGRRGSTLSTGTKTQSPVDYDTAKSIYNKLVREKIAKGYTPGADGAPYQATEKQQHNSGVHCQLLNPIEESDVARLINDPAFCMQEKFDGRRLLIQKTNGIITGINKLGLWVAVPQPIHDAAIVVPGDFLIDGEAVGDTLHVFDLLSIRDEDTRGWRYGSRCAELMNLMASAQQRALRLVQTAFTAREKRALFDRIKSGNGEGIVFKQLDAPYTAGRPNSGGAQFKFKFVETASFIVGKANGKRSVSLKLFDGTDLISVGNVTIPPNREIPESDQVVEVRYLYAYKGGSIFQPVYLDKRDDVRPEECGVDQLKYKPEPGEVAA